MFHFDFLGTTIYQTDEVVYLGLDKHHKREDNRMAEQAFLVAVND